MNKFIRLKKILKGMNSAVVAFSGGVDSSFLLKVASETLPAENISAVTAVSDTYTDTELLQAKRFARALGVEHRIIFTRELNNRNFTKNLPDRCYYCKRELFGRLKKIAGDIGIRHVVDASNVDDKKDYRPGSIARKEFGVKSPLQEAGMTKNDIRRLSKKMGLATWDMPPMACLASRVPYGRRITKDILKKIRKAEDFIRHSGARHVRVRHHGDIARIEAGKKDIKIFFNKKICGKIIRRLKALGFCYVALDLEGYRTGSLNEGLSLAARSKE